MPERSMMKEQVVSRSSSRLSRFTSSSLVAGILKVAGGNTLAQIIVVLFAPLITRIYSPEVFGVQGVFLAALTMLSPLAALRYPLAIVIAENEQEVRALRRLSWYSSIAFSMTLALVITASGGRVADLLGLEQVGALVYLLPVALLLVGFQDVASYTASREQRFKAIGVISILQALLTNSARVLGGLVAPTAAMLVSLATANPGVLAVLLSLRRPRPEIPEGSAAERTTAAHVLRKYISFPLFRTPTDFLNAASEMAPVILFGAMFGPAFAGFYTLARSVLRLPTNVIGNAVGTVFYSDFAERARSGGRLGPTLVKSTLFLLCGPGVLVILVGFVAPDLFSFAFGAEWRTAGEFARWMTVWTAISLAHVPAVRVAPVIHHQGRLLIAHMIMLVTRVGSFLVASLVSADALTVVAVFALVSAAGSLGLIVWMYLLTRRFDRMEKK